MISEKKKKALRELENNGLGVYVLDGKTYWDIDGKTLKYDYETGEWKDTLNK